MEFETKPQQATYEMVEAWINELFGGRAKAFQETPAFLVQVGSTVATVTVNPWGDEDALIGSSAYVVSGAEPTPELMRYLLRENYDRVFGAFSLDEENGIYFQHNLIGSSCQKNELESSVLAVVQTADDYDDQIVARFGGKRALDVLVEEPTA